MAMGGAICWVVSTGHVVRENLTGGGPQGCMDSPKGGVGGLVPAVSFPPCFDDSLIVAINLKRCSGTVELE